MSLRRECVRLANQQTLSFSELCSRFDISRKIGYTWLSPVALGEGVMDRSRRPIHTPTKTPDDIEAKVVALRLHHPAWGGRKLAQGLSVLGMENVPAPSTITHILKRHDLIHPKHLGEGRRYQRFEHERPNDLWQMDVKGYCQTASGRCAPLNVLENHSRYNIVLDALYGTSLSPVQQSLIQAFRQYGLPQRMHLDNGQPWGSPRARDHGLSTLSAWLVRLGIQISFSRPAHPQTKGKDERFHRGLKAEVLQGHYFRDRREAQARFTD